MISSIIIEDMRRVLLVVEDYNELRFLETLLKKVGFDVECIRNELSLDEKMLGFSPDLVVATGEGNKINGIRVGKKVKKKGSHSKLLLLFPRQKLQQEHALENFVADGAIETPLNPRTIITSICQLTGVDNSVVMAKFEKLPIAHENPASEGIQIITSKKTPPKTTVQGSVANGGASEKFVVSGKTRGDRYNDILKKESAPQIANETVFSHQKVASVMEQVRKEGEPPHWDEIAKQRVKFLEELLKKNKK